MKPLADALAIFSLFFGAGNAVFPILLGLKEKDYFLSSFAGLLVTGIILSLLRAHSCYSLERITQEFF